MLDTVLTAAQEFTHLISAQRQVLLLSRNNQCQDQSTQSLKYLFKITQLIPRGGRLSARHCSHNHCVLWLLLKRIIIFQVRQVLASKSELLICAKSLPTSPFFMESLLYKHQVFLEHLSCIRLYAQVGGGPCVVPWKYGIHWQFTFWAVCSEFPLAFLAPFPFS